MDDQVNIDLKRVSFPPNTSDKQTDIDTNCLISPGLAIGWETTSWEAVLIPISFLHLLLRAFGEICDWSRNDVTAAYSWSLIKASILQVGITQAPISANVELGK